MFAGITSLLGRPLLFRWGHCGIHLHGNCWGLRSLWPTRTVYRSGDLIWYSWWRFYLAIEKLRELDG